MVIDQARKTAKAFDQLKIQEHEHREENRDEPTYRSSWCSSLNFFRTNGLPKVGDEVGDDGQFRMLGHFLILCDDGMTFRASTTSTTRTKNMNQDVVA